MTVKKARFGAMDGYREPLCYELTGRAVRASDNTATWAFQTDEMMTVNGEATPWQCLKLANEMHLVSLPERRVALFLDGAHGRFYRLSYEEPRMETGGLTDSRGVGTAEDAPLRLERLVGHALRWRLSCDFEVIQAFPAAGTHSLSGSLQAPASPLDCRPLGGDHCVMAFQAPLSQGENSLVLMFCDLCALRAVGCRVTAAHGNHLFSAYGGFLREDG